LAYLAAGYTDGFFETGLSPWDIAAGSLLVTEAGGLIGNYCGEAPYLDAQEVMAASPKIYAQMVPILKPFSKFNTGSKSAEEISGSLRVAQTGTVSLKASTSPTSMALKKLRSPMGR
jgi:myo-inositol-1(or 4)-monophosphatase